MLPVPVHSHQRIAATAARLLAPASHQALKTGAMNAPPVKMAATIGAKLGWPTRMQCCGTASAALVMSVSRNPSCASAK